MLFSPAIFIIGMAIDPNPVSADERHRLIDTFNASLAPTVSTDGAGAAVSGTF
jgi:hypothetical protein